MEVVNTRENNGIDYSEDPYPENQLLNERQCANLEDDHDDCDNSVESSNVLRLDALLSSGGNG